ncbi:protein-disulfide reductase DsbD N-terminal domain-containing protein [Yinghuangia soli]|uniref:Protein-disulfide reductase DsbD N-terminal domain-containing protein n=1 Tax=Yinghuangia soli TaxID=2908204 RepID=A0AA41Q968_9ACTN|nr:protein-disulfide reductase DsbD N-terminal domain-containing protein [Yinghuangia soli]MCF2532497.1 protein-disulfide reductase DsbD N-terminal domain-containing protein [Yinghuangia soli]
MTVTIGLKDRAATRATLVATLTPERAGFHLYSIDLPAGGIEGIGRPVSLTVRGVLAAAGPLTAESAAITLELEGTGLTLPVYPDGPVTVDLPVTVAGPGEATLLIGYAACSKSVCLPPVSQRPVSLKIS